MGEIQLGIRTNGLLFAMFILLAFLILVSLVSMMKIYKKAGKPAISAIIPIWNMIVLLEIVEKPVWYVILYFVPIAQIYVMFVTYIGLAKKFGKSTGFGVAMVFFSWIMIPLLSFSDYQGNEEKEEEAEQVYNPLNQTDVAQVMPSAPIENIEAPVNVDPSVETVTPEVAPVSVETPVVEQNEPLTADMTIDNKPILGETVNEEKTEETVVPENTPIIPEVKVEEGILPEQEVPAVEEAKVENVDEGNNQDIQNLTKNLYEDKPKEAKDIAFGSAPIIETNEPTNPVESMESIETVEVTPSETLEIKEESKEEVLDNANIDTLEVKEETANITNNESIELPEVATKTCPACGVSLAEDTKFCIACGTQL